MTPVTDAALIEQLERSTAPPAARRPVTDPALLEQLDAPLSTAETAADVGESTVRGFNRGVANLAMLPLRASAWLTGTQGRGFAGAGEQLLSPYLNQPEPETRAGRYAQSTGEALGGSIVPGGVIMRAASKVPLSGQALPTLADRFLRPVATAPGTATAIDLAASTGSGLAQEGAREAGGGPLAQTAAGLAGGVVPVVAATAAARQAGPAAMALRRKIGIHASADGAEPPFTATPRAQDRAVQMIADQLSRSGRSVDDLRGILAEADQARNFGPPSLAQNALAPVDLDEGLQRLAGSAARQHPEAANIGQTFISARQTGITPPEGARAQAAAAMGLPTRAAFAAPITGAQAQRRLGSSFETPQDQFVPMGQMERVRDALKRSLRIRDEGHHGHLDNAYRTEQAIVREGKLEANKLYGEMRAASQGYDIRPHIQPVIDKVIVQIQSPDIGPTTAKLLRRALAEFTTGTGANRQLVSSLNAFDEAKRAVDAIIETAARAGNNNVGRILRGTPENPGLLRELLDAVDGITHNNAGQSYRAARGAFSSNSELREAIELGRKAFRENSDVTADHFASLSGATEQKLFRLGLLESFEQHMGRQKRTADVTQAFENPRVQDLLSTVVPRSEDGSAAFATRPERLGRFLESERRMIKTRDVVRGGSTTARNLADDEAFETLSTLVDNFRTIPSAWGIVIKSIEYALDKAFGMRAETAKALAQMLFTADPARRAEVLTRVSQRMGPERLLRFNAALQEAQQATAGAITAQTPMLSAPASQPQQQ